MMKVQIALDASDLTKALKVAEQVAPYCDILELGSLLLLRNGIPCIENFRSLFPDKQLLADIKLADHGRDSVTLLAKAGINIITVLAGTHKVVVTSACKTAAEHRVKIMLDLLDAASQGQSAMDAESLGASSVLFHRPYEEDGSFSLEEQWDMVRGNTKLPIFVTGKINRSNINQVLALKPAGIIIGHTIIESANPADEAKFFYDLVKKH